MTKNQKEYKVVIQLSGNDEKLLNATIGQIHNILKALESIQIEVVTHSKGIQLLFNTSGHLKNLKQLHKKGVEFLVCQNALNTQNIEKDFLLPFAKVIPSAAAHLIVRQEEGWSYLRMN